jgi:hypothetical protein
MNGPGLVDRFIDRRRFRYPIHKKYLVKGKTENVQDGFFYFLEWKMDGLLNNPVKPKLPPQNPLKKMNSKCPVSFT